MVQKDQKKLRIIELIGTFTLGGAELFVSDLSKGLMRDGYEVQLVALFDSKEKGAFFKRCGKLIKERSRILVSKEFKTGGKAIFSTLKARKKLEEIINDFNPDVIHTHTTYPDLIGKMLKRKYPNIKVIRTIHTTYDRFSKIRKILIKIEENLLPHEDKTVFVSKKSYNTFNAIIKNQDKCEVPIAIDLERFNTLKKNNNFRSSLKISNDSIVLATVGRLVGVKNQSILIETFSKILKEKNKEIFLLIIGDGPLRKKLEGLVKDLNIEKNVLFLGYQANVDEILSNADIFISPSLHEGFGISLIEAMTIGKPIIVSSIDSFVEILGVKNVNLNQDGFQVIDQGIIFSNNDSTALFNSIKFIIENKNLWKDFSKNAILSSKKFDINRKVLDKYEKIFLSLVL